MEDFVDLERFRRELGPLREITREAWEERAPANVHEANLGETKLKLLIRKGIPDNRRGDWWMFMSGCPTHAESNYRETFERVFGHGANLENPRTPTFGASAVDFSRFFLTAKGESAVKRVLCCIASTRPDVEVCLLLPVLVTVLMHYLDEPTAYHCVTSLLDSNRHVFLIHGKKETIASADTFYELVKSKFGALHKLISRVGGREGEWLVGEQWQSLVTDSLTFPTLLRALDSYFFEGSKVVYRAALAVVSGAMNTLTRMPPHSPAAIVRVLHDTARLQTSDSMLAAAFRLSLSRKTIIAVYERMRPLIDQQRVSASIITQSYLRRMPTVTPASEILSPQLLETLWGWVPNRFKEGNLMRLFTSSTDGYSLTTLYKHLADYEPTLLVVHTAEGAVFGAYAHNNWGERKGQARFFGTGECFLFTLGPTGAPHKYEWAGEHKDEQGSLFQIGWPEGIAVGAGGGHYGFFLAEDLNGTSETCETFDNAPLTGGPTIFQSRTVEAYAFTY